MQPSQGELSTGDLVEVYTIIQSACRMAHTVSVAQATDLVRQIDRETTIMPLVNPTAWMQNSRLISLHEKTTQAFLKFRQALAEIEKEYGRDSAT